MEFDFALGDMIRLKKEHACGGTDWQILRVGMDFRLKCTTCNRIVMLSRVDVNKRCKKIVQKGGGKPV